MNTNWLWDQKITLKQAKDILTSPDNRQFVTICALLLGRMQEARVVFKNYVKPLEFCRKWLQVKKQMRRDSWNNMAIIYWQAIYKKLMAQYRAQGVDVISTVIFVEKPILKDIGAKLRAIRRAQRFSQREVAAKLKVSQQIISHIESGRENVSLLTLENVAGALGKKVIVDLM